MDARTALSALAGKPIHPARRVASWMGRPTVLADPPEPETTSDYRTPAARPSATRFASEARRLVAERLGFHRVGLFRHTTLLVSVIDSEVFVDDTATVRLAVGKTFEAFDTYFDDGSCLMTWTQAPELASDQALAETGRIGMGDFTRDLLAHRTAVAVQTATGRIALRFADVDAHLALNRHYMLREIPLSLAWRSVFMLTALLAVGSMILAKIAMAIARSF